MFYIFEQDEALLKAGLQLIEDVLQEDLPKDAEVYRRFTANEIGAEEPLVKQLVELFGTWPLPEELREEREEEAEELEGTQPLPTEEEMKQRLSAAIKKAFSDYSKV